VRDCRWKSAWRSRDGAGGVGEKKHSGGGTGGDGSGETRRRRPRGGRGSNGKEEEKRSRGRGTSGGEAERRGGATKERAAPSGRLYFNHKWIWMLYQIPNLLIAVYIGALGAL
jgi:hypothetical protein